MAIVFSERDIEDYAEGELDSLLGYPGHFLVGRQVVLSSGRRLDLLAGLWNEGVLHLTVIELKSVKATTPDLAQLMGYIEEVTSWYGAGRDLVNGALVAPEFDPALLYVMQSLPGLWPIHVRLEPWFEYQHRERECGTPPECVKERIRASRGGPRLLVSDGK